MNSVIDLFETSAARRKTASCWGVARSPRRTERVVVVVARPSKAEALTPKVAFGTQCCQNPLPIHLATVAEPEHAHHDAFILDIADDAPVADPILPVVAEPGARERLADVALFGPLPTLIAAAPDASAPDPDGDAADDSGTDKKPRRNFLPIPNLRPV